MYDRSIKRSGSSGVKPCHADLLQPCTVLATLSACLLYMLLFPQVSPDLPLVVVAAVHSQTDNGQPLKHNGEVMLSYASCVSRCP